MKSCFRQIGKTFFFSGDGAHSVTRVRKKSKAGIPLFLDRFADFISKIEIIPLSKESPTKCRVGIGYHGHGELFTFDISPEQRAYPLFLMVGWSFCLPFNITFDTDVEIICHSGVFPTEIRVQMYDMHIVTKNYGTWQMSHEGYISVPSPKFLKENGYTL